MGLSFHVGLALIAHLVGYNMVRPRIFSTFADYDAYS